MNFNPKQMIKNMIGVNSPKDIVMQMLQQGGNNNPIFNNLIDMANNGNSQGVEQFARNLYKENGKNFDKEFNNFKNMMGIK